MIISPLFQKKDIMLAARGLHEFVQGSLNQESVVFWEIAGIQCLHGIILHFHIQLSRKKTDRTSLI